MSACSVALMVQISLSAQPRVAVPEPAGLFFWLRPRFHAGMDPELGNIIRQALADAQAAGRDYLGQTDKAIQAVRRARPGMTTLGALSEVNRVRRLDRDREN